MNNLNINGEFRYVIEWFNEWSELQRDDFVPVMVEYLMKETNPEVYMNGMVNSVANVHVDDKPMSLFQCRIKLFREWSPKWPLEFKQKLTEKIFELDANVGEKVVNEMNGTPTNKYENGFTDDNVVHTEEIRNVAVAIVDATEEAINADNRLTLELSNETSVDDEVEISAAVRTATPPYDGDNEETNTSTRLEPAQQVQLPTSELVTAVAVVAQTVTNNAEVPLVA